MHNERWWQFQYTMCFLLFWPLQGFALFFTVSVHRFCVNFLLFQFSNYQLSSNAANYFWKILWGGIGAAILQIILFGSNPYLICISFPGGTFSHSLPNGCLPPPRMWCSNGPENPWPNPENNLRSKWSFSDMWNLFFMVPYLLNSKCSFIRFMFWFHFFNFLGVSLKLLHLGLFQLSVCSERYTKLIFINIGSLGGNFQDCDEFGKNSNTVKSENLCDNF